MILAQQFYINLERKAEILYCLKRNIENPLIDKIYLFVDLSDEWLTGHIPKLDKIIKIDDGGKRIAYRVFFDYFNQNDFNHKIIILANLDIFFGETLQQVKDFSKWDNHVMALSRWDWSANNHARLFNRPDSQDVWIWKSSPSKFENVVGDYPLGMLGCDNRIANELSKTHKVINPSISIRCFHYHESCFRPYDPRVKVGGDYTHIPISSLGDIR